VVTPVSIQVFGTEGDDPFALQDGEEPFEVRMYALRNFGLIGQSATRFRDGSLNLPVIPFGADTLVGVMLNGDRGQTEDIILRSGLTTRSFTLNEGDAVPELRIFTMPPQRFTRAFGLALEDDFSDAEETTLQFFELGGNNQGIGTRAGFAHAVLPDGRIVVAGGVEITMQDGVPTFGQFRNTIEIFDPHAQRWTVLSEPDCLTSLEACAIRFRTPRAFLTASVVNGDVVFVGGITQDELREYPVTNEVLRLRLLSAFEAELEVVESFGTPARAFHTATAIGPDRVIIAGGMGRSYASPSFPPAVDELIVEGGEVVYSATDLSLNTPRALHAAEYFVTPVEGAPHGIILAGGRNASSVFASTEIIYLNGPDLDLIEGPALRVGAFGMASTPLTCRTFSDPGEYWLLAGGMRQVVADGPLLAGAEPTGALQTYEVAFSEFLAHGDDNLATPRAFAQAIHFPITGDMLVAGGVRGDGSVAPDGEWIIRADECNEPLNQGSAPWRFSVRLNTPRAFATMLRLPSQLGYIIGGTSGSATLSDGEFYNNFDFIE
jgi:hypothetical protein